MSLLEMSCHPLHLITLAPSVRYTCTSRLPDALPHRPAYMTHRVWICTCKPCVQTLWLRSSASEGLIYLTGLLITNIPRCAMHGGELRPWLLKPSNLYCLAPLKNIHYTGPHFQLLSQPPEQASRPCSCVFGGKNHTHDGYMARDAHPHLHCFLYLYSAVTRPEEFVPCTSCRLSEFLRFFPSGSALWLAWLCLSLLPNPSSRS